MRSIAAVVLALVLVGCAPDSVPVEDVPPLDSTTPEAVLVLLASSESPVVVNVWASWCVPCRSEAPLLRAAAAEHETEVRFIGIAVRDSQEGARRFVAEFGLTSLEHYFDPPGAVPGALGGRGVPITFFFAAGGERVAVHHGVIDERSLALAIDDLLRGG